MDPGRQFEPGVDATPYKAKRKHPSGCRHCANVTEYHMAREAAQVQRESATNGFAAETKDYGPIITFKDWLVGGSRQKDHSWH